MYVTMGCKQCKNKMEEGLNHNHIVKLFCSDKCRALFHARRLYLIRGNSNRDRVSYNRTIRENYKKNKIKYKCRAKTNQSPNKELLIKSCKECGNKEHLQIHHEVYPVSNFLIREAIKEGKIYYLCMECHYKKENKKIRKQCI